MKKNLEDKDLDIKKDSKFHEKIINTAQSIVLILDPDGRIISFNPYMEKITGYKIEEVKGKDWFDTFLPGRDHNKIRKVFKKAIGDIQTRGNVNSILTKEGKEIFIEWYDNTLKDKKGNIIGLLCIGQDVTEKIKAEKELKKSKKKYKKIYEETPLLNFIVDKKARFLDANKTALRVLGYKKEEIIGKKPIDFMVDKELGKIAIEDIKTSFHMDVEKTSAFECDVYKKDGSIMTLMFSSGHLVLDQKNQKGLLMSGIDITERKKAEIEKDNLQKELRKYAKKLEIKIKNLEKKRIRLTKNEKKVLWGITAFPYISDSKLAKRLKLKRSTVTAIRNRLSDKGLYTIKNVPNFKALGAGLLTLIYGKLNKPFKKLNPDLKKHYCNIKAIHSFFTKNEFMCMVVSKDMADFEKKINPFRMIMSSETILKKIDFIHLFSKINKTYRLLDYSDLLKDLFDIEWKKEKEKKIKEPNRKLSENEKKVLLTMIEYPGLSSYDMSFKVDLTRITVSKIKKRLIKGGFLDTKIIPNFKKLGLNLLTLVHTKHSAVFSEEKIKPMVKNNPHCIFFMGGAKEAVSLNVFKNYEKYKKFDKKLNNKEEMFLEPPSFFHTSSKDIKINKLNFIDIARDLLKN